MAGDSLIRRELCVEAIRLGRTLCELMPQEAESLGLLALMLLHDSRREARVNTQGELVPLEEQERSLWDRDGIRESLELLQKALRLAKAATYQLHATIAAVHAEAQSADETDWLQIAALYGELARIHPSAVVALNHAVAVALGEGEGWRRRGQAQQGLQFREARSRFAAVQRFGSELEVLLQQLGSFIRTRIRLRTIGQVEGGVRASGEVASQAFKGDARSHSR